MFRFLSLDSEPLLTHLQSSDGILGFSKTVKVQQTPAFIKELKNIKALAAGSNHILALDSKGNILAWGCGQQNQLGRRIIERNKMSSLIPQGMGLSTKKIEKIACGQYHSFAIDTDGKVWTWGLNNFGETGIREGAGEDDAVILRPALVESLEDYRIVDIAGGQHHSLACSEDGKLLTWGRFDGFQVGFAESDVNDDDLIRDEHKNARILAVPTVVPSKLILPRHEFSEANSTCRCPERLPCRRWHGQLLRGHHRRQSLLLGFLHELPDRPGHLR